MFKLANLEDELRQTMEKTLLANQVEQTHGFNKLAKAADYLNAAAEIFENAGMHSEASAIIDVLEEVTEELR